MVIAELRELVFHPIPPTTLVDLADPRPQNPEHFGYSMRAMISHRDGVGADSFDATVCSPTWLAERLRPGDEIGPTYVVAEEPFSPSISAPALWIVRRWDRAEIEHAVRALCDRCSPGPDWDTVADRIGRWLPWEYDYRYDEAVNRRHGLSGPAHWDA